MNSQSEKYFALNLKCANGNFGMEKNVTFLFCLFFCVCESLFLSNFTLFFFIPASAWIYISVEFHLHLFSRRITIGENEITQVEQKHYLMEQKK
jgi:hypothetical protein